MAAITIPTTIFLSNKLKSVARIAGLGEAGKFAFIVVLAIACSWLSMPVIARSKRDLRS
jgi:hypothetical protein